MTKPQITRTEAEEIIKANRVSDRVILIGIRGYYLDTFGRRGENDRGVYDDAILLISPRRFETFRANTDPSIYRKGIATMKTGVHRYYKGKHKNRYWALRLVGEQVPVTRDGESGDRVGIALNIHQGGWRTTGSEGCQTLMPNDWDDFIELVYDEMDFYGQTTIPYVLIEEKERRAGKFKMPHILSLETQEIDNLLIRFDKQDESVAQVDNLQIPTEKTAVIPPTPNFESQPQDSDVSAVTQPIQNILDEAAESVPSFGGYKLPETIGKAIETGNQVKEVIDLIKSGKDGKKSLWTYISQVFFQVLWAIVAFFVGLPREIWIVIAVIVAVFAFYYLYRQIALGKIRETVGVQIYLRRQENKSKDTNKSSPSEQE